MDKLFIIKSKTFRGVWHNYCCDDRDVYAEHYLALGKLQKQPIN